MRSEVTFLRPQSVRIGGARNQSWVFLTTVAIGSGPLPVKHG